MKIMMTGLTSFTGVHIAKALSEHLNFEVVAPIRRRHHSKIENQRLSWIEDHVEIVAYDGFETGSLLKLMEKTKPHVFIQHGFHMDQYRSGTYEISKAFEVSGAPLPRTLELFKKCGGKLWVYSGTVFEPGEGGSGQEDTGTSLYGVMKSTIYQILQHLCVQKQIHLLKVVIPNPIGIFENEDRMIPVFFRQWLQGQEATLLNGSAIVDQLPAPWLGKVYSQQIRKALSNLSVATCTVFRPAGRVTSLQEFAETLAHQTRERLGIPCHLRLGSDAKSFRRINPISVAEALQFDEELEWENFWTELIAYYGIEQEKSGEHVSSP